VIGEEDLNAFRYDEYIPAFLHLQRKFACINTVALPCTSVPIPPISCTFRKTLCEIVLNLVVHNYTETFKIYSNFDLSRMTLTGTFHVELHAECSSCMNQ
jgi:hypothetical protein